MQPDSPLNQLVGMIGGWITVLTGMAIFIRTFVSARKPKAPIAEGDIEGGLDEYLESRNMPYHRAAVFTWAALAGCSIYLGWVGLYNIMGVSNIAQPGFSSFFAIPLSFAALIMLVLAMKHVPRRLRLLPTVVVGFLVGGVLTFLVLLQGERLDMDNNYAVLVFVGMMALALILVVVVHGVAWYVARWRLMRGCADWAYDVGVDYEDALNDAREYCDEYGRLPLTSGLNWSGAMLARRGGMAVPSAAGAAGLCVNGKVFYRRYGKDSFPHDGKQIYLGPGKDFSL